MKIMPEIKYLKKIFFLLPVMILGMGNVSVVSEL